MPTFVTLSSIMPTLVNLSIQSNNFWSRSKSSAASRSRNFRANLLRDLKYSADDAVKCMVSQQSGIGDQVIAAHIIPCSAAANKLSHLGLAPSDLNLSKNGLFLARNIELAFDRLQVSFVKSNPLLDTLFLKIWDDSCRETPIWDGSDLKIGAFEGAPLRLDSHTIFKRCLSFQAYQAYFNSPGSNVSMPVNYGSPGNYAHYSEREVLESQFYRDAEEIESDEE